MHEKSKERRHTDSIWLDLDALLDVGHFGLVALPLGDDFCIAQGVDESRASQSRGSCRGQATSGEVSHRVLKRTGVRFVRDCQQ
jgi:hypothetical protein